MPQSALPSPPACADTLAVTRGLIFDLDGTLVHSLPGIAASLNRALATMGTPQHPEDAIRGMVGNGVHILAARALPPGASRADADTLETAFKTDYAKTWPDGSTPYPGITGLLQQLQERGELLAVLSNKTHPFAVEMVATIFPTIHFAAVVGQKPGVPSKPDPAPALALAAALGVLPESCYLIGDSTVDLETARRAGMRSIAVSWGYHNLSALRAAGPDEIADDPQALADLLTGAGDS